MDRIIPKEELSGYQRWELVEFGEPEREAVPVQEESPPAVPVEEPPPPPPEPEVHLPTAEEIEHIHQQAHDEGYAAGLERGRQEGYAAGYEAGMAEARAEAGRLKGLVESATAALAGLESGLAEEMNALILAVARQVTRQALRLDPEAVLAVVKEALATLPQSTAPLALVLHPEDAALVQAKLSADPAAPTWRIVEDERMTRGGCRLESETGELDATVENRWHRLVESLGRHDDWNA